MVAPLAVAGALWERRRAAATRLLTARTVRLSLGGLSRAMPLGTLLAGLLMIGMGLLAGVLAFVGPTMSTDGWQTRASASLQHLATVTAQSLSWVPGWAVAALLVAGAALLLGRALRGHPSSAAADLSRDDAAHRADQMTTKEHS
jgi:hypothetical protein